MPLSSEQEKVKKESIKSQEAMHALDQSSLTDIQKIYSEAVSDIQQIIVSAAYGATGTITVSYLGYVLQQIKARLGNLSVLRNNMMNAGIQTAAAIGANPFAATVSRDVLKAAEVEAIAYVQNFVGPDKLSLSDRIWRIDRHAEQIVDQTIQTAVVRGQGATQAALEFITRNIPVPAEIGLAKDAATARSINATVKESLLTGRGAPLDNAMRVMRTEINRAHTRSYQISAKGDTDSIGTKFQLSPRHPRVDICDMHARANLFGLGAGVYPHGRSPLPAHPNTLSFEVIVYRDEVTAADRQGKQTVVEFLEKVPSKDRKGILGANKNEAFEAGNLPASQVSSTWRSVEKRISRTSK